MGKDWKAHLTGNKKRPEIGRIENSKRDTIRENSRSFETIPSSQNLSVQAVGRDKTDGRRTEVRPTLWQKIENFFFA